jgi:SAM-dependent methyltransferase
MTLCVDSTINYYESHAAAYAQKTLPVDMAKVYERFLKYLPSGARILDAGSGSGRDSRNFMARGYEVEAFDASPTLAALSAQLTGAPTKILCFQEFDTECRYEGIWACASLLHLKQNELADALARLQRALKADGVIYLSFKSGSEERIAPDGRRFTDMNKEKFCHLIEAVPQLLLIEIWLTPGEGAFCGQGEWFNALLRNSK